MAWHVRDIIGVGEIIGHFTYTILKFFEYWTTREERAHLNRSLHLRNLRTRLEMAREFGLSIEELRSLEAVFEKRQKLVPVNSGECTHCPVEGAQPFMPSLQ